MSWTSTDVSNSFSEANVGVMAATETVHSSTGNCSNGISDIHKTHWEAASQPATRRGRMHSILIPASIG